MMAIQEGFAAFVLFSFLIIVKAGINFRNEPDTVILYAGQTVYMRCELYPDPTISASAVSVTWIKTDNRNEAKYISMRGQIFQADPNRFSIEGDPRLGEHDLKIENVQYGDAGLYRCQVNQAGSIRDSAYGRLTVRVPIPVPTCSMDPPSPRVGQRVTLTCAQQMHPSVNYEALNWWNDTSRSKILTQSRYSDGSIYFTRMLTESDRNQRFICSQGLSLIEGERNCSLTPLPRIEISSLSSQRAAVDVNPPVKFVAEGSSATFSCNSNVGQVTRWVYGYGTSASKIRETKNRFLLNRERTELTVIRTTLADNGTAVRCIVIQPDGGKLVAQSILNVLPSTRRPLDTNPRIPPPPPPISTNPPETERPSQKITTRPNTERKDASTVDNPGTSHIDNSGRQSNPNSRTSGGKVSVHIIPTETSTATKPNSNSDGAIESPTRGDAQIVAETDFKQNSADISKSQTGSGFKAGNPHQVANNKNPVDTGNGSGIAGAVMGTLLIVALIVLIVFLVKTKRYPKTVPSWIPPHIIAVLKRPAKKPAPVNENMNNYEKPTSKETASMRMKQIEVVVNPPPPEWQFRVKDVETNRRSANLSSQRASQMPLSGPIYANMHDMVPVYANITPGLSKSQNDFEQQMDDDDDDDSMFSEFDDDLDLEGEIAAEIAARTHGSEGKADSMEDRKSRNVEGLVYAQLDMGPNADKRSTVYIEGEKTQYAHIIQNGQSAKRK